MESTELSENETHERVKYIGLVLSVHTPMYNPHILPLSVKCKRLQRYTDRNNKNSVDEI